jgi:pilus assembly protein CpaC
MAGRQILLHVRIAGAGPAALQEMNARLAVPPRSDLIQASAFRPGWDLEKALRNLQGLEILTASHLVTRPNRGVSFQAGAQWDESRRGCGIRIQFLPTVGSAGTLRLRVEPEVTAPQAEGVATRKIETEVELLDGQSFLVTGLLDSGEQAARMIARLFPGQAPSTANRELVVLGTLQLVRPAPAGRQTAALVKER